MIALREVTKDDIKLLWEMQVKSFEELLAKYQDYDMSPGAETFETIIAKFEQPWTKYYFICNGEQIVGGVRVVDKGNGTRKRISPIWIMQEHRNKGYAQEAIKKLEALYGENGWALDTILQETGNLHLYEKLGYRQTRQIDPIKDGMDIVYYEKN